jgi:hypothetical protein
LQICTYRAGVQQIGEYKTLHQLLDEVPWLTERWVRSMVADGRLPKRKVGGRLLFHLDDLAQLVAEGYGAPVIGPEELAREGPR